MGRKRAKQSLVRIGWREWVTFPNLGKKTIPWIKAKVDTGARTSAIHAESIEFFTRRGKPWVRFTVHPKQNSRRGAVSVESPLKEAERQVRSSNGAVEYRPVIETTIAIGEITWQGELSLANRDQMGFRLLLGRSDLKGRFIVDVSDSFVGPEPTNRHKVLHLERGLAYGTNGRRAREKVEVPTDTAEPLTQRELWPDDEQASKKPARASGSPRKRPQSRKKMASKGKVRRAIGARPRARVAFE